MDLDSEEIAKLVDEFLPIAIDWGINILSAIVILILGFWIARWGQRTVAKVLNRTDRVDDTLTGFLGSLVRYIIIAFTVIAVLGKFGVQTTSIVALIGAFGLAVGLALQGTLADVASGVLLLFFRPFKQGDFVQAGGISGSVRAITLFNVELATPDNRKILVPNGKIWGEPITNFSAHDTRRVDFVFGISYEDNIDKAMGVISGLIEADARCLKDPGPQIVVSALADSSVNITVRVWAASSDYWGVNFDLIKAVKESFDQNDISIPYPHQVEIQKSA